jgi:hypothetical protein
MSPTFTARDMDHLSSLEAAFRTELPRVFAGLSASDFTFPVLHELTHITQDRLLYGNDQVTSTQLLEHYHIEAVKHLFRQTARRLTRRHWPCKWCDLMPRLPFFAPSLSLLSWLLQITLKGHWGVVV